MEGDLFKKGGDVDCAGGGYAPSDNDPRKLDQNWDGFEPVIVSADVSSCDSSGEGSKWSDCDGKHEDNGSLSTLFKSERVFSPRGDYDDRNNCDAQHLC